MSADQDLDALISEVIASDEGKGVSIPSVATSNDAVMNLAHRLIDRGYMVQLQGRGKTWAVTIFGADSARFEGTASTLGEALARAIQAMVRKT